MIIIYNNLKMTSFEIMWKKSVNDMIQAIKSDNNISEFFMSFEPDESTGYAWTQDKQYRSFSDILDHKTGNVHSGSSFACCVREAVIKIREDIVIVAGQCASESNPDITTLMPL